MSVTTIQGVIENGQVVLTEAVDLPEKKIVYVVIPDFDENPSKRILSPRLVDGEQAKDFVKTVENATNA
jgi:hypothetical protein